MINGRSATRQYPRRTHPQESSDIHVDSQQIAHSTGQRALWLRPARWWTLRQAQGDKHFLVVHDGTLERDEAVQVSLYGFGQHEIAICERPRRLAAAITSSNFVSALL
jgi:hypothetical protein